MSCLLATCCLLLLMLMMGEEGRGVSVEPRQKGAKGDGRDHHKKSEHVLQLVLCVCCCVASGSRQA